MCQLTQAVSGPRFRIDGPGDLEPTGEQNLEIGFQLKLWTKKDGRGGLRFECGLPFTQWARRSPGTSWIRKDRVAALPKEQLKRFYYLCPDFVIELRSSTDRIDRLKKKMEEYMANGSELGWLIDPEERTVWIYRPGHRR